MHVVAARPNFVKAAPIINAIEDMYEQYIVHTGQHYDKNLSDDFFDALDIPEPTEYLKIGSGRHGAQTAKVIARVEECLLKYKPDLLIVYGDVNSTMGAAIAASKMNIKVAHIESGLRSFDRTMPEEINRVIVDSISDYHFVTEQSGIDNLLREGHNSDTIFFVGNTMIDSLYKVLPRVKKMEASNKYILMTMHRPSNVDNEDQLKKIVEICHRSEMDVVFPIHPRTEKSLHRFKLFDKLNEKKNVQLLQPIGYFEFISLMKNSLVVITDSGGIQEETTAMGVPCLTLRGNTERPVTITEGTNILVETSDEILNNISLIEQNQYKKGIQPKFWDGLSGKRIAEVVSREIL